MPQKVCLKTKRIKNYYQKNNERRGQGGRREAEKEEAS